MSNNRGTESLNIPIQFHTGSYKLYWQIVSIRGETGFAGSWFYGVSMEHIHLEEGWELVRSFIGVKAEDETAVLDFLVKHGQFAPPDGSARNYRIKADQLPLRREYQGPSSQGDPATEFVSESFSLRQFATIQDYVRRMLITGDPVLPTPWEAGNIQRYEIAFARDRLGSKAHVLVNRVFPSILATVQFKLVQGAKFKVCARKDCRLPFEVSSRHKRRFCTQYCAHITSLRQRRREVAKAGTRSKEEAFD